MQLSFCRDGKKCVTVVFIYFHWITPVTICLVTVQTPPLLFNPCYCYCPPPLSLFWISLSRISEGIVGLLWMTISVHYVLSTFWAHIPLICCIFILKINLHSQRFLHLCLSHREPCNERVNTSPPSWLFYKPVICEHLQLCKSVAAGLSSVRNLPAADLSTFAYEISLSLKLNMASLGFGTGARLDRKPHWSDLTHSKV